MRIDINKGKSEKGSITLFVVIAMMFFSIILLTGFIGIKNKLIEQDKKIQVIQNEYQATSMDQKYRELNTIDVSLPDGMTITGSDGESSIDEGVVAVDKNGNKWVWIEVPKTATVYSTAGTSITESISGEFTDEEYVKIYNDLKTYTADYKNGSTTSQNTSSVDTWYSGCGIVDELTYNKLKNKMLKSIYKNEGFWIGQYEIGTYTARKSKDDELTTPVCRQGAYPYNYVTCSQAQELASRMTPDSNRNSSLMFGIQWDLVLKFIETKATKPGTSASNIKEALRTNSSDWGNYCNVTFEIQRGEYSVDEGETWKSFDVNTEKNVVNKIKQKEDENYENGYVVLTTGATNRNSLVNIYDLAGNVWEWTLEKNMADYGPCSYRGGSFYNNGGYHQVALRWPNRTFDSFSVIGFRPALY